MKKINLGQKELIHFVGIGGIGMSGLAQIMKNMGFKIQGSDQNKNKNTINCSKIGIKVFVGHLKKNVILRRGGVHPSERRERKNKTSGMGPEPEVPPPPLSKRGPCKQSNL